MGHTIGGIMIDRAPTRGLATVLALGLTLSSTELRAAPANDTVLDKVSKLAQEGQTRFETADFAAAIELWTQAYAELPDDPRYGKRRNVLAYQIAKACIEAYTLDPKQRVYLRKAERLFDDYLATIDTKDQTTRTKVEGTLTELREQIRLAEEREAAVEAAAREEASAAAATAAQADNRQRDDTAAQEAAVRRKAAERAAERDAKRSRRLMITGGAILGGGAVLLGVMGYGLSRGAQVDRDGAQLKTDGVTDPQPYIDLREQGFSANQLAVTTAAIGGTLLVVGLGLLVGGATGLKRARRDLAVAPSWHPGGAGLTFVGRF